LNPRLKKSTAFIYVTWAVKLPSHNFRMGAVLYQLIWADFHNFISKSELEISPVQQKYGYYSTAAKKTQL